MSAVPMVTRETGENGLPTLVLAHPRGGRATVYLHGAHVARWTDASGDDILFLSGASKFGGDAAIRGGIPVIFPQFAEQGPLPKHGFARTSEWSVVTTEAREDRARVVLALAGTHPSWPHPYRAELSVALAGSLTVALSIVNLGAAPMEFTCALHSYLRVDDVRQAAVLGLRGARYRDKPTGGEAVQESDEVRFDGEVDRVYLAAPDELRLRDGAGGRTLAIRPRGSFADTVVWNPGPEAAAAIGDLEEDGWRRFVCVEAARARAPVRLEPGRAWGAGQTIARI